MSQFHAASLELLGWPPTVDTAAGKAIARQERRTGVSIPAAVAEWYALPGATDLRLCGDRVVGIDELGEPLDGWGTGTRDFAGEGLLIIRVENQGVCHWAVPLDEGDDPRVLVEVDSRPDNVIWRPYSPSFSEYVFTLAWDSLAASLPFALAAQDGPLDEADLALLKARFTRRPSTYSWPGRINYRFERGDQRVTVWNSEGFDDDDPRAAFNFDQADWTLQAGTADSLAALARELLDCGGLATSLYAVGGGEEAERVVAGLRS